jgi:hypothetical protein
LRISRRLLWTLLPPLYHTHHQWYQKRSKRLALQS